MKRAIARSIRLSGVVLAAVSLSFAADGAAGTPLPTDWSSRHVIFSRPTTTEQVVRTQRDPRYAQQQLRHEVRPTASLRLGNNHRIPPGPKRRKLHPDWAMDLGPAATVGEGHYPAKYAFDSTVANCAFSPHPDFIVYGTGLPGADGPGGQGSILAFTNLYQGCSGQVPGVYWSYNTGGTVNTSPVPSRDGTQFAFTQTVAGAASLVLLRWKSFDGLVQTPSDPTVVAANAYAGCTAPCMTTFALGGDDTNSSVFYDYSSDRAWVGDDAGVLHQYTGVFLGTPAEVVGGGWPVSVHAGVILSSAVHDNNLDDTFVRDATGFLYRVDSSGVTTASGQLDFGTNTADGPILDASIETLYVSASNDGLGSAAVYQLSTSFAPADIGTEVTIGASSDGTVPQFDGGFDHNYLTSADSTGSMYICGNPGAKPTLYQVSIVAGAITTAQAGAQVSITNPVACSPVTVVYNPNVTGAGLPQEWAFLGTEGHGIPTGCNGHSCVMNFKVTSWQPSTVYNKGQEILDSNLHVQVCDNANGTSGTTQPVWSLGTYQTTLDGGVHWRNQGVQTAQTPAWVANNAYPGASKIVDPSNNVQIAQLSGGTSGGTMPTWGATEGDSTTDGTITWINLGASTVAGLQESGGTSGIVIDNTANLAGASQIYFSTLANIFCATSGGVGGCAVQASQVDLQ